MGVDQILSRGEVESLIAAGNTLVVFQGDVLRLNTWADKHPGGSLVFQHMIGRDATDEMNISHSIRTLKTMHAYRIGKISGQWENFTPPIQGGVFRSQEEQDAAAAGLAALHKLDSASTTGYDSAYVSEDSSDSSVEGLEDAQMRQRLISGSPKPESVGFASIEDAAFTKAAQDGLSSKETYIANSIQHNIDADLDKYPSLDAATQRDIAVKFQALHERVRNEGYYDLRPIEYGKEMLRYTALFIVFVTLLNKGWYFFSACFLGLFWHQIMFTAHDAGHRGITADITKDTMIGIFIADFCCGLSIGWWKSSHNVHHLVTNSPEHDPDIQNVPLFATSPSFFDSISSTYYGGFVFPWDAFAGVAVLFQKYTYYPIMAVARFNLYILSWGYLLSPRSRTKGKMWWTRPTEIVGISVYFFMFFYVCLWRSIPTWTSRAIFLLTSHLITMPLHVQITLSHWGTSTADLGPAETFAQRQLRTTMDVACPQWLDFIHGGLQFQAVHHLFPRVPRHNLRKLQALVRDFCKETEIEYLIHDFVAGNGKVLGKLQEVADQARILAACQAHMAATGESGLH
ncbi:hypothetical protein LTR95_000216 [Oleoguttula sp. CCFEE 5521]